MSGSLYIINEIYCDDDKTKIRKYLINELIDPTDTDEYCEEYIRDIDKVLDDLDSGFVDSWEELNRRTIIGCIYTYCEEKKFMLDTSGWETRMIIVDNFKY